MNRFLIAAVVALLPALLTACGGNGGPSVHEEEVTYRDDGTRLEGFLAYDRHAEGPRPGVLVVHEWWGHNEHARNQARKLAELGYTALALDMYGEGRVAEHPDKAGEFAGMVRQNRDLMLRRFRAAEAYLRDLPQTDADRMAAIGYCFGGSVVLEMARAGADLEAVASFHGGLATDNPAREGEVEARILVLHGNEDPMVPPEQVEAFREEMEAAGVDYRFVGYDGATHSFTNPAADEAAERFDMPVGYNAEAAEAAWEELERFLAETFDR